MSSGEHPVLVEDGAATGVVAQVLQGHKGGVLTLGCVGAVHNSVNAHHLLKTLRQGYEEYKLIFILKLQFLFTYPERQRRELRCRSSES